MPSLLLTEVVAGVVVAALSGGSGAAYQIHRRRSRPFILVEEFTESLQSRQEVEIPVDLCSNLNRAFYLEKLKPTDELRNIHSSINEQQSLQRYGAELLKDLDSAVDGLSNATDDQGVLRAVIPPLQSRLFDELMLYALRGDRLNVRPPTTSADKVGVRESDKEGGCFYLNFRGKPTRFGYGLTEYPYRRDLLQPLVSQLKALDKELLKQTFADLAELLRQELNIAAACMPALRSISDKYSRWEAEMYVANYGESAMLILPQATLEVKRGHFDRPIREECFLASHQVVEGKKKSTHQEKHGLLVPPGAEKMFSFITTKAQSEMPKGNELRGRFEDGQSRARFLFACISAGLRPRRSVSSAWFPFK
jgi:hypothetical protein